MKSYFYSLDFMHNSVKSGDYVLFAYGQDKKMTLGKVLGEKEKSFNVLFAISIDKKHDHYNLKEVLLKQNQIFKIEIPDSWLSDYESIPDEIFYGLREIENKFKLFI